uniref:DUF4412 domain-containing protein n=1 Tax=Solibacter usitatus (strain Ellin6076) TaxID=234267 RepID=Q01UI4_SOLUE
MNRLIHIAAGSALLVFGAAAQVRSADEREAKLKAELDGRVQLKTMGAVRGMTVKGAPYSADEINETTQVLADGTRIHREIKTSVSRDSEGRVRRETPENITITDPVANVTYILNPKSMTGQKLAMAEGNFMFYRTATDGPKGGPMLSTFTVTSSGDGQPVSMVVNGQPLDDKAVAEAMAKAKESGQTVTYDRRAVITHDIAGVAGPGAVGWATAAPAMRKRNAGEPLGKQMIEGVNAEGTRNVETIEAGKIGNDRPIQVTSESWYSEELQMTVLTKHSDPRTGDESFRVTNIRRGEPGAYLFQPPAGYQINERK